MFALTYLAAEGCNIDHPQGTNIDLNNGGILYEKNVRTFCRRCYI